MTQKLSNLVPNKKLFSDVTEVQRNKEELINKTFIVLAHTSKIPSADGDYEILLCEDKEGKFTTTAGSILFGRLHEYGKLSDYKDEGSHEEKYFRDGVEVTLKQEKSKNNKKYFVFA
jgi:hypothetical protein